MMKDNQSIKFKVTLYDIKEYEKEDDSEDSIMFKFFDTFNELIIYLKQRNATKMVLQIFYFKNKQRNKLLENNYDEVY